MQINNIEQKVLQKLFIRRRINHYHMRMNTLLRSGFKSHERGEVKKAIKSLIKKDFIRWVKKREKALSLNKNKIAEIERLIRGEKSPV